MRHLFYSTRKIRDWFIKQGYDVNRKKVRRLIRLMGIVSITPKSNTSKACPAHKKYPYLLSRLDINHPDQVCCSDITYIRGRGGFVYLTAVWTGTAVLCCPRRYRCLRVFFLLNHSSCLGKLARTLYAHDQIRSIKKRVILLQTAL